MDATPARRSDPARQRILRAARVRFAQDGYAGATVRTIAADARIDPSLVMRYYGSKEGLFAAAAELDLNLPDLSRCPRDQLGEALVRHFVRVWESSPTEETLIFLLRSAVTSEVAAARMHDVFARQIVPALRHVVPAGQAEQRAALVTAQVLGLALSRYIVRFPAAIALDIDTLVTEVGATIQRYLTGAPTGR